MNSLDLKPPQIALRISGIYFVLGCLWILFSDKLVSARINDKALLTLISMIKGFIYVFISAVVIFILIYVYLKRIKITESKLLDSYRELTATHEQLESAYEEISTSEEELHFLAYHDSLTDLPNKLSLEDAAKTILGSQEYKTAILFIDVDNFKYINDSMGHAFGDKFIITMSRRLRSLLKEGCSVYRIGGDEFIIIARGIENKADAEILASHIHAGFKERFEIDDSLLSVTLSIGIAVYPEHGSNVEELLNNADMAMYKAKEQGKNRYALYDRSMKEVFSERVDLEKYLRSALEQNEFEIHYQPQFDLKLKRVTGFEALLRWRNPELGFISPLRFIRIAEDTHLIIPLGTWTLRNACAFLKRLHNEGHRDLTMSVNISILQLLQSDFVEVVRGTLEFLGLEPGYLELEITESILMESFDAIGEKLQKLREIGVRIALDDFGKGYSSLSYLKQLPISTLKIDKSFIDSIPAADENQTLTRHIITIGNCMGMCIIAEGVERQEQLDYLIRFECHKFQGYLFSKPISEENVIKLLEAGK